MTIILHSLCLTLWLSVTVIAFELDNPFEVPVYNDLEYQRYNISIKIGTPSQVFNLLLDTASTDVWVPKANSSGCTPDCPIAFDPAASSSIVETNIPFDARYGLTPDLAVVGEYYNDTISLPGTTTIKNAPFAVGDVPKPLFTQGNRGIFGLGSRFSESVYSSPTSPFRGDLNATYTPLWERVALASPSRTRKYSVWLNAQGANHGSVQFGGEDPNKYDGQLTTLPLNLDPETHLLTGWNVNVSRVTRGRTGPHGREIKTLLTAAVNTTDFTLDTGSPNMYVPTAFYNSIVAGLNATEIINGAPYVPCLLRSSSSEFLDFEFPTRIQGRLAKIRVPYPEIIYPPGWPVTVPAVPSRNGQEMCYFGVVPTDGSVRLLGTTFLRSAYVVFDADKAELRMAQARWQS